MYILTIITCILTTSLVETWVLQPQPKLAKQPTTGNSADENPPFNGDRCNESNEHKQGIFHVLSLKFNQTNEQI